MNIEVVSVKFVASFQVFTIFDHIDMKTEIFMLVLSR